MEGGGMFCHSDPYLDILSISQLHRFTTDNEIPAAPYPSGP